MVELEDVLVVKINSVNLASSGSFFSHCFFFHNHLKELQQWLLSMCVKYYGVKYPVKLFTLESKQDVSFTVDIFVC